MELEITHPPANGSPISRECVRDAMHFPKSKQYLELENCGEEEEEDPATVPPET